ncbi:DUF1707 domain-containing protein [uncultured Streptomyces sp.]|uniref:DUF1707 SHOCT-like domain-containing protein n=1 Tax=uncultured Streptomyces sp. TaxID=174707 RepID=UPI00260D6C8A|nr:DUF1707 domain-containing protein [uncultured Streptomyces sp.]
MRASDVERERVAEILRDAVAEGRLDMEEFEQRLDATYKARTRAELTPLVRDLPASGEVLTDLRKPTATTKWSERIGGTATSTGGFAFWGGFSRKGRWTIGPRFTCFAMWGGGEVDLREARFEGRETVIRCVTVMGGIGVVVPPDVHLVVNGIGLLGGFDQRTKDEAEPAPDAPRVRVTGLALLGGVGVDRKWSKAERQRRKEATRGDEQGRITGG